MSSGFVGLAIRSSDMVQFMKTMRYRNTMLTKARMRPLSASQQLEEVAAVERAATAVKAAKAAKARLAKAAKLDRVAEAKALYLLPFEGALREEAEKQWDAKIALAAKRSAARAANKASGKPTKTSKPKLTGAERKARLLLKTNVKLDNLPLSRAAITACVRLMGHFPAGKKQSVVSLIDPFITGLIETNTGITGAMQWDKFVSGSVIGKLALTVIIGTDEAYAASRRQITECIQAILLAAYEQATLLGLGCVTRSVVDEATSECMAGSHQLGIIQGYFEAHGCPMCGSRRYGLVTTNGSISFRRGASQVVKLQASLDRLSTCVCI